MNQSLGTSLAFTFLIGVGIFHLARGVSDLRSRNRSHIIGWFRIAVSTVLIGTTVWFYRNMEHGLFG